jgi:hypothetical protein
MSKTCWQRWVRVGVVSVYCLGIPLSASLNARQVTPGAKCAATISIVGPAKACPIAQVKFNVRVSGCVRSSGGFTYEFLRVSEIRKETVSRTVLWTHQANNWDQDDHVTLACDEEIDDVQNARVTSCRCEDPANN